MLKELALCASQLFNKVLLLTNQHTDKDEETHQMQK